MKRFAIYLTTLMLTIPGLTATSAVAQTPSGQIEKQCYGGRNQMGLHVCTCDQGWISGMSALVLGNSTVMFGAGTLANCLAWADQMNGVTAQAPARPRKQPPASAPTPPPILGNRIQPPIRQGNIPSPLPLPALAIPPVSGPCGPAFNQCANTGQDDCVTAFNQCSEKRIDANRQEALASGLASQKDVETWRAASALRTTRPANQPMPPTVANTDPIIDNWNTGGCDLTGQAEFRLTQTINLTKLETYFKWDDDWKKITGQLIDLEAHKALAGFNFYRGKCHPTMPEWCYAQVSFELELAPGRYRVNTGLARMCTNTASGNTGYMKVYGTVISSTQRRSSPDLPPLTITKPPMLGMPGNRQGTGGGFLGRFGTN